MRNNNIIHNIIVQLSLNNNTDYGQKKYTSIYRYNE